ncbi:MAG: hypothetical protein ABW026_02680 [Microvirga sp.]
MAFEHYGLRTTRRRGSDATLQVGRRPRQDVATRPPVNSRAVRS